MEPRVIEIISRPNMNLFLSILALLLAAILGIFAHRARVCTVAAVEELLDGKRPSMLFGFLKAILWVMAVVIAFKWAAAGITKTPATWQLSISGIIGGLIFGIGAAVNGNCAISTLRELAQVRAALIWRSCRLQPRRFRI